MNMKNTRHTIAMSCISIAMCIVTLFSFSFSWIKREWSPVIQQESITITATSALSLIIDGKATDSITLTDYLNTTDINLQQVSNYTGRSEDFFYLESDGELKNAIIKHVDRQDYNDNTFSQKFGYVEIKFLISGKSQDGTNMYQNIYLKGDNYQLDDDGKLVLDENGNPIKTEGSYLRAPEINITDDAAGEALLAKLEEDGSVTLNGTDVTEDAYNAADKPQKATWNAEYKTMLEADYQRRYNQLLNSVRISITTEGFGSAGLEDTTVYRTIGLIGGKHEPAFKHQGLLNSKADGKYVIENQNLYNGETVNSDLVRENDDFVDFNEFVNGKECIDASGRTYYEESKTPILTIKPNTTHYVTLRIWLEGMDPGCTEEIAGLKFDLLLRFDSEVITQNTNTNQGNNQDNTQENNQENS